jgi:hypothetical protein
MEITTVLSSAKTAFTLARALQDGLARQQIKPEEVPARLMELQQHILTMQAVVHDLAEENRQLKHALGEFDDLKKVEADLEFIQDGAFLVRKSERAQGIVNPICPICWGETKKVIPMMPVANGFYMCKLHKASYQTAAYKAEQERIVRERAARSNQRDDISFWGR